MNFLMTWNEFINNDIVVNVITAIIRVVLGFLVTFILFKVINKVTKKLEAKFLKNKKFDKTLVKFLVPFISKVLKLFLIIFYIGYVGIETSSIAAAITSAGLAIGLAMQGSLSNFAGGFVILLMRPFKVGDYIETCGEAGTVDAIEIFYTTLITGDNKVIRIPNGSVANANIVNYSQKSTRRLDMTFSISYDDDFEKAKKIILDCAKKTGLVLDKPAPFVNVSNHGASSIDIVSRFWVKNSDYWDLKWKLLEAVKTEFDKNGIEIPYNKLDVNLNNPEK